MAEKMVFLSSDTNAYEEEVITYQYYSGFAVSQKQKSIRSLHSSIKAIYPDKEILEISTKSDREEGIMLSAFNLEFYHEKLREKRHIENVFQASKVFRNGGPYQDLLNVSPKDAKRDERLNNSGSLIGFSLYGVDWPLEPKTMFYDWIYITALKQNMALAEQLLKYDIFTDIEFNYKKSFNCQARTAAIFVSLCRNNKLEEVTQSPETFRSIYGSQVETQKQMSFL